MLRALLACALPSGLLATVPEATCGPVNRLRALRDRVDQRRLATPADFPSKSAPTKWISSPPSTRTNTVLTTAPFE